MPLIHADVFAVLIMNEHKNLTNVVIGKLGKLVHKQNCSHDFFIFINYNIIIVQVRYLTIETNEATRIVYNEFLFPHSYSSDKRNPLHSIRIASIVCCVWRAHMSGADPGFQVRGGALKKIAPSGGRRENFWGILRQKIIFFPILGGARPPLDPPLYVVNTCTTASLH